MKKSNIAQRTRILSLNRMCYVDILLGLQGQLGTCHVHERGVMSHSWATWAKTIVINTAVMHKR